LHQGHKDVEALLFDASADKETKLRSKLEVMDDVNGTMTASSV